MPSAFATAADLLDPPQNPWAHNPVGWVEDRLDEFLWSKQRTIAESVRDHRYTAVHACHDSGKSYDASRIVAWWLDTHPPGTAFVISTAPTFAQVRGILWREIGRAHRKGKLAGTVNQTEWHLAGELVGFGRKPSDTDPAAFQGIHAEYVLVIIDEACGVPKTIFDAADALVTNEGSRMLAIGNPDDAGAHFAEVCKTGSGWNVIHIDGLETPNFTDEPVPDEIRPLLLSRTWVEERKARWGENSPLYIAKVRGLFPEDADDGVVRASKLAQVRRGIEDQAAIMARAVPVELGVDVGAGGDETVIRERRGKYAGRVWKDHSADPEQVVGKVVNAIRETGATVVKIDVIGIGWGVAGWLEAQRRTGVHAAKIVKVNVGAGSTQPKRFPRLRDQIWWEIGRELCEDDGWNLAQIDDDTAAQLLAPKYNLDASGRIKVEQKDETRSRIGRSPDDADALLLAYYVGRRAGTVKNPWGST